MLIEAKTSLIIVLDQKTKKTCRSAELPAAQENISLLKKDLFSKSNVFIHFEKKKKLRWKKHFYVIINKIFFLILMKIKIKLCLNFVLKPLLKHRGTSSLPTHNYITPPCIL